MSYSSTNYTSYLVDTQVSVGSFLNMEKNTISVVYRLQRKDGGPPSLGISLPYGLDIALAETSPQRVLPVLDSPFPDTTPPSATWQTYALCRSHNALKQDKYIDVRVVYDTFYHWLDGPKGNNGGTESTQADGAYLPVKVSYQVKTRQSMVWKSGGTAPSATSDSVTITTGSFVGQGVTPQKVEVSQMSIRLQAVIDVESQANTATAGVVLAYIGKRNSDTFLGYTAGQLVCVGGSLTQLENEFYMLSLEYEYDEYFEHNQICETNPDGKIKTTSTGQPNTVYWKRPTRTSVNFNDIWPAGALGYVQRYLAENGRYW
jgi:hypothetical protein